MRGDAVKAAIITYHRAVNYGSALQAYALNAYIRSLGIECETIDYRPQRQADLYTLFEPVASAMAVARNMQSLIYMRGLREHKKRFEQFLSDNIPQTENTYHELRDLEALDDVFDLYITGSDQVWNPRTADFDSAYLLSFVGDKSRCMSYAPSLGAGVLPGEYRTIFHDELSDFRCLSAREERGAAAISEIVGRPVATAVDPVFLLDEQDWGHVQEAASCKYGGEYIFGYFIGDVPGMREFADKLAKETGLKVLVVFKNLRDLLHRTERHYDAGPKEFLWYVSHARYVVTNSFHATAFSIIFRKDFWTFVDGGPEAPGERIRNILDLMGLRSRMLDATSAGSVCPTDPVCWSDEGEKRLAGAIDASKRYLDEGLSYAMR